MGHKDHYLPLVKATILKQCGNTPVYDICHEIEPFNIAHAAQVLKNVCFEFPENTIHLIGVKSELGVRSPHVLVKYKGHYFVSADNGVFSLMFEDEMDEVYEITLNKKFRSLTFPVKDVFVDVAAHLMKGGIPEVIGRAYQLQNQIRNFKPTITQDEIKGQITSIDSYGNAISNISRKLFDQVGQGRAFTIVYGHGTHTLRKVRTLYGEVSHGERLAIFNSLGRLEIAINQGVEGKGGTAHTLLGLKINDVISIVFHEH